MMIRSSQRRNQKRRKHSKKRVRLSRRLRIQMPNLKVAKMKSKGKSEASPIPMGKPCDCMATEHSLIGNCLNCGKIICQQEGRGPCTYCGYTAEQRARDIATESFEKAAEHKDKLIEYQATSAKRTVVYDDQEDYYNMNQWIDKDERQRLMKKAEEARIAKEEARRKQKITFDFAGRKVVIADDQETVNYLEEYASPEAPNPRKEAKSHAVANPTIAIPAPVFQKSKKEKEGKQEVNDNSNNKKRKERFSKRIQHQYFETTDIMEEEKDVEKTPFSIRGFVDSELQLSPKEMDMMIEFLHKKNANHYLHVSKSDIDFGPLYESCKKRNIDFNLGFQVEKGFDYTKGLDSIIKKFEIGKKIGIKEFTVIFQPIEFPEDYKKNKELSIQQANMINDILKKTNPSKFHVKINFPNGGLDPESPNGKKTLDYWKEIHTRLEPRCQLILEGPSSVSEKIPALYMDDLKEFFENRKILIWDNFPPALKNPHLPFVNSYNGREWSQSVEGILICPHQNSYLSLCTVFDFLNDPTHYRSENSLRFHLFSLVKDERIAQDMYSLIEVGPTSYPQFSENSSLLPILVRKFKSQQFVDEILEKAIRMTRYPLPEQIVGLKPFFETMETFCRVKELQFTQFQLKRADNQSRDAEWNIKFESVKEALQQLQAQLKQMIQ
eukprot:TRINITY_DN6420_c0_g1_i3.p1 TRINITY_DN6420_c0_g1~~TRINITY_DN6420_c0_g1_i3.p1  ORF type:complete len:666 (+),score=175.69 TRINITY_DN6420_c0_g1_i3:386-2383(+)